MADAEQTETPSSAMPLDGDRILVVDDEADIRVYLSSVLEDAGAKVYEATDGDEALVVAKREVPDLITLDLSMPGTDGVQAFCALRQAEETRDIPVCIVTGHAEYRELIYQRSERAPEGFMSKPIPEEKLVSTVRRILGMRRKRAQVAS